MLKDLFRIFKKKSSDRRGRGGSYWYNADMHTFSSYCEGEPRSERDISFRLVRSVKEKR
jgi:hypothetical protein